MNYSQIWEKIENLPWCALVTSGRHGSDYFQSLLDSHPEVFVFNGVLFFHNRFWVESSCINFQGELNTGNREAFIAYQEEIAISDLVNEFIGKYIYKFKSKYDHDENKHQLGESRQESIDIDLTEFHTHCVGLARQRPLSSRNFLQAIYTAYALCLGQDIMKKNFFFITSIDLSFWMITYEISQRVKSFP